MPLETEIAYFRAHRAELMRDHAGKYALIVGEALLGVFDHAQDAYADGLQRIGNRPMLIQLIADDPPPGANPALTLGLIGARL